MDSSNNRLIWIDWMKVIGIFFIIAGHLFVPYYNYIYVFSVPLFFIISGFLYKNECFSVLILKVWKSLIRPCLLLCIIVYAWNCLFLRERSFHINDLPYKIFNVIIGYHGQGRRGGGLDVCWFIYTLGIIRILHFQIIRLKKLRFFYIDIAISLLFLFFAIILKMHGFHFYNSWINVFVCYPFFVLGSLLCKYKDYIRTIHSMKGLSFVAFLCLVVVILCGYYNEAPWMYDCRYGNNIILFIIGGFSGSVFLFVISKWLSMMSFFNVEVLTTLSKGNIIILGLHPIAITYVQNNHFFTINLWTYLMAAFIVVLFYPIILLSQKYFPILLGNR